MIRVVQKTDITKVADIWLDTNIKAHNFIPAEYWKSNFKSVKEALLLAEVVGNHVWDEYPTYDEWIARFDMDVEKPDMDKLAVPHFDHLPIWANGNAYLMGAKAWKKETDKFVDADTEVTVELVEKDGFYELETNIYEILGDYSNGIITSDILGKAFEPEQRFEERDESDIIFNVDFYGNHRGVSTIPGPLAK